MSRQTPRQTNRKPVLAVFRPGVATETAPTPETLLNAIEALCDSAIEEDSVWADGLPSASRAAWVKKHLREVLGSRR